MSDTVLVLNGPNLNLLGQREPAIYGTTTLGQIRDRSVAKGEALGFKIDFRQSNFEGELINWLHEARETACGVIFNPAGYSFTSVALLDALKLFEGPKIELHISNIHARESIYQHSLMSRAVTGVLCGFGAAGYELALEAMSALVRRS